MRATLQPAKLPPKPESKGVILSLLHIIKSETEKKWDHPDNLKTAYRREEKNLFDV